MSKTRIDWATYSINPVKGLCPVGCSYCYARRMYSNPYYKALYNHRQIQFIPAVFNDLSKMKLGSKVFWGSTMELFGDWVKPEWMFLIMEAVKRHSDLIHIFLTKRPANLIKHSPFPDNVWVGVSTTGFDCRSGLEDIFSSIRAKVKFVSIEPLLDYSPMDFRWVNWIICGQQTPVKQSTMPKMGWIAEIVEAASKANVPVFLKENLISCVDQYDFAFKDGKLRQEFPKVK